MTHRSEDELFSAWLRGDKAVVEAALRASADKALEYAVVLFGGKHKCKCGSSAEDVASIAVIKFARTIESGLIDDVSLLGYLMTTVYTTFVDLTRRAGREISLTGGTTEDGKRSIDIADLKPSPLRTLIAREEAAERRKVEVARLRVPLLAWCAWPAAMSPLCTRRPTLRDLLKQMEAYLRTELTRAGAPGSATGHVALVRLAETVDPEEVQYMLAGLNAFLEEHLKIDRNVVDLRWKYLKQIACAHSIPRPPGLMRDNRTKASGVRSFAA